MLRQGFRLLIFAWLIAYTQGAHAARYKIFDLGANIRPVALENIKFEQPTATEPITTFAAYLVANEQLPGGLSNAVVMAQHAPISGGATDGFGWNGILNSKGLLVPDAIAYWQNPPLTVKTEIVAQSFVTGINTNGVICGWIIDNANHEYAVYWNFNKQDRSDNSDYKTTPTTTDKNNPTNPVVAPIILPPHKDDDISVFSRATAIDAQGNIVGYTLNKATGFRRAVAWIPDYSSGEFAYKAKDLGRPAFTKKDIDGNDVPYFSNEPTSRSGIAVKVREGYAVGLWQIPTSDYPTPVIWNIFGTENDAYLDVSARLGKEVRGYVTDLIGSNYLTGFTLDALKEKEANPGVDWYALAIEDPLLAPSQDNRRATRWFATTRQQPGTDRVVINGFGLLNGMGDLGDPNAIKILATPIDGDGIGGTARDTTIDAAKQPQAFFHTTQCGILNANYLFSSLDTKNDNWNLQAILTMSSFKFEDIDEHVNASWLAGTGIYLPDGLQHGFVLMPAMIRVDLSVTMSASPAEMIVGEKVTYTINVTHHATQVPDSRATCVRVDFQNPQGVTVQTATPFRGRCEISLARTNCLIPYMLDGESNTITLTATPRPMLADRTDNKGSVMVYSSETGYGLKLVGNILTSDFPNDPIKTNNFAQASIDVKREGCFIATAAYDSYLAPEVQTLREFRDHVLRATAAGRWLVDRYYDMSPPIADWIGPRPWARTATRLLLTPAVYLVAYPLWTALVLLITAGVIGYRWKRRFA